MTTVLTVLLILFCLQGLVKFAVGFLVPEVAQHGFPVSVFHGLAHEHWVIGTLIEDVGVDQPGSPTVAALGAWTPLGSRGRCAVAGLPDRGVRGDWRAGRARQRGVEQSCRGDHSGQSAGGQHRGEG
jgi:hypothetical protein